MSAHWRCNLRIPPGHQWQQVALEERNFIRCERCGKEKWPPSLRSSSSGEDTGEGSIKMYGRGFGQS
jgi:hypothetical protein